MKTDPKTVLELRGKAKVVLATLEALAKANPTALAKDMR